MSEAKEVKISIEVAKAMNIYEKLTQLQARLEVKKEETNSQLKSKYRKVETILQELKPLLLEYRLNLTLSDEILAIGTMDYKNSVTLNDEQKKQSTQTDIVEVGSRFYIKANAILINIDDFSQQITSSALSREAVFKKGVQVEMLTGMASTYARKKTLEGLFLLADNDAIDPDSIIDEQVSYNEKQEAFDELYNAFLDEINNSTELGEKFSALAKRIKNSYISKAKKEILLTVYTTKGQELNNK